MTWKPARAIEDMRPLDPTPKMRTMLPGVGDFVSTSVDESVWCDASGSEQHFKSSDLDIGTHGTCSCVWVTWVGVKSCMAKGRPCWTLVLLCVTCDIIVYPKPEGPPCVDTEPCDPKQYEEMCRPLVFRNGFPCTSWVWRACGFAWECSASGFLLPLCLSCCCCCLNFQTLLRSVFGAGPSVESLWNKVLSPPWDAPRSMQSAGTESWTSMAWDLVCQNCSHFSCARLSGSSRRRPDEASICHDSFLFSASTRRCWILLLDCSRKGLKGVMRTACRPSFPFPPVLSPARWSDVTSKEYPRWNKNSFHLDGTATWPISSGAITFPPVCPGIARIYNRMSMEILQYWNLFFLLPFEICSSQAESEKVFSEMRPAVLDRSISNEQHHQFLFLLRHGDAPTSHHVRDSDLQSISFKVFIDRNVSPSSFFTWNKWFWRIVHQIRLNCWLRRMSFPSAQWYLHFQRIRCHFHGNGFPTPNRLTYSRLPGRVIWITFM